MNSKKQRFNARFINITNKVNNHCDVEKQKYMKLSLK